MGRLRSSDDWSHVTSLLQRKVWKLEVQAIVHAKAVSCCGRARTTSKNKHKKSAVVFSISFIKNNNRMNTSNKKDDDDVEAKYLEL